MRQTLVPVLLLVAVALSSSKVLPLLSTSQLRLQLLGIEGQQNDNTYSYKDKSRNVLNNIFYNMPVDTPNQQDFGKLQSTYFNADNNRDEHNDNIINNNDNRDEEGFRKEQWHNYPRQLDRLHNKHQNYDKRNLDPGEIVSNDEGTINKQFGKLDDGLHNEFQINTHLDPEFAYDVISITANANPLLNLKFQLAFLSKSLINANENFNPITQELKLSKTGPKEQYKQINTNGINPVVDIIENKRIAETLQDNDITDDAIEENKMVTKRIFSLWSRVQGLSHKGHEILQRRRHMHTFYGIPDGDGGRALTAETRAILMRPPGSPLRWG